MTTNNSHRYTGASIIRFFYGTNDSRISASYKLMLIIADKYFDHEWESPEDCIREMDAILSYTPYTVSSRCAAWYILDIRDECISAGYANNHTYKYYSKRYSEVLTEIATTIKRRANGYFEICQLIATN